MTDAKRGKTVLGLAIDGNSVMGALVSRGKGGEFRVEGMETLEVPKLVERVRRISHPIFMDLDRLHFEPGAAGLARRITSLFGTDAPVIGVLPPDSVALYREYVASPEQDGSSVASLVHRAKSRNPIGYPRVFGFKDGEVVDGRRKATLWSCQFEDLMASAQQYRRAAKAFTGVASGLRALAEAGRLIGRNQEDQPLTLVDVGKLRTVYLGIRGGEVLFSHVIPVGLAREDTNYFETFPPVLSEVERLEEERGMLFQPAHMTPSPLHSETERDPRMEFTRLSVQIARFVRRVVFDIWRDEFGVSGPVRTVLSGRSARVPGLRESVEARAEMRVDLFEEEMAAGLERGGAGGSGRIGDHLLPLGAAVALLRREESRFGLVLRDRRPVRFEEAWPVEQGWKADEIYIVERPRDSRSAVLKKIDSPA